MGAHERLPTVVKRPCLKHMSHVYNDLETLLSLWYYEIDYTVTFLVLRQLKLCLICPISPYSPYFPSEQLQRGGLERGRPCSRHERRSPLCRQGGHLWGAQDVRRQRRLWGLLQRTGEHHDAGTWTVGGGACDTMWPGAQLLLGFSEL